MINKREIAQRHTSPVMPKKYNVVYDGQGNAIYQGQIIGNMFTDGVGREISEENYLENWAKQNNITIQPNSNWLAIQPGYEAPPSGGRQTPPQRVNPVQVAGALGETLPTKPVPITPNARQFVQAFNNPNVKITGGSSDFINRFNNPEDKIQTPRSTNSAFEAAVKTPQTVSPTNYQQGYNSNQQTNPYMQGGG